MINYNNPAEIALKKDKVVKAMDKQFEIKMTTTHKDWREEFREYFDKTLKSKKPTMGGLDRELCIDFIEKLLLSQKESDRQEMVEWAESRKRFVAGEQNIETAIENIAYNQALFDLISELKNKR